MSMLGWAGLIVILLPTLGFELEWDQGIFQYFGWGMLRGLWPYRDLWDTSFPAVMLLHAGAIAAFGKSAVGIRVIDLAWQLCTAGVIVRFGKRIRSDGAGWWAAIAYAVIYRGVGAYHTAQRDSFLVLPLMLAALSGLRYQESSRRRDLLLAGLFLGQVATFRPTYALFPVVIAAVLLWGARRPRQERWRRAREVFWFSLVAAGPLLATALVFVAAGKADACVDLLRALWTVYPRLERMGRLQVLWFALRAVPVLAWIGVAAACRAPSRGSRMLLGAAALCLLVRLWESKGYRYQFWPLVAVLMPVAEEGWSRIAASLSRRLPAALQARRASLRPAGAALVLLALGAVSLGRHAGLRQLLALRYESASARDAALVGGDADQAALAGYLRDHTSESDTIALWGPRTGVLVAAGRRSATRFTDPFLLFCEVDGKMALYSECDPGHRAPIQDKFRAEILDTLTARPPRYIAAHDEAGSLAVADGPCSAPDLPELRRILDTGYAREVTLGKWSAFRRRAP
jgi:hypothetical protein